MNPLKRLPQAISRRFSSFNNNLSGKTPNIAIAGVTGAVGQELLQLIETRNFPYNNIKFLASSRSVGKKTSFMGNNYYIEELGINSFDNTDIAFFCCGGERSLQYAPAAAKSGAIVIDNSSVYRMDPDVPLIVPEINRNEIFNTPKGIIANPNCSTIIMNIAVWPIYAKIGVSRIIVSTYQAASGAGLIGMNELEQQAHDYVNKKALNCDVFGKQYIFNLFSHNTDIDKLSGYNEEELKMINETKKIFNDNNIQITATCVRVPVLRAHCESINLTLNSSMTADEARELLRESPGIVIQDDREGNNFPEPINASFGDNCLVGRIRQDLSQLNNTGLELFVSCDQIRKGAALNAIQIAEVLINKIKYN